MKIDDVQEKVNILLEAGWACENALGRDHDLHEPHEIMVNGQIRVEARDGDVFLIRAVRVG